MQIARPNNDGDVGRGDNARCRQNEVAGQPSSIPNSDGKMPGKAKPNMSGGASHDSEPIDAIAKPKPQIKQPELTQSEDSAAKQNGSETMRMSIKATKAANQAPKQAGNKTGNKRSSMPYAGNTVPMSPTGTTKGKPAISSVGAARPSDWVSGPHMRGGGMTEGALMTKAVRMTVTMTIIHSLILPTRTMNTTKTNEASYITT